MIYSFSYLAGQDKEIPEGVLVFDVRHLKDPAGMGLGRDGRDEPVKKFVVTQDEAATVMDAAVRAFDSGRDIAFGCAGGIYRSVACATTLYEYCNAPAIYHMGLEAWQKGLEVWKLQ